MLKFEILLQETRITMDLKSYKMFNSDFDETSSKSIEIIRITKIVEYDGNRVNGSQKCESEISLLVN